MINTRYNIYITERNTFKMKVKTVCMVEYDNIADLDNIREWLFTHNTKTADRRNTLPVPILHIGGGSNLLFTKDFPGTILHSGIRFINVIAGRLPEGKAGTNPYGGNSPGMPARTDIGGDSVFVEVGAGTVFDDFCAWAADNGLWGVENLSGIPGETGAAAVQNIGAYGAEAKDVIETVNCYDMVLGKQVSFRCDECGYGYRDSLFKRDRKGRHIVTSVIFRLSRTPRPRLDYGHLRFAVETAMAHCQANSGPTPDDVFTDSGTLSGGSRTKASPALSVIRQTIMDIRKEKLPDPDETGNAGSFFKNPVVPKSDYDRVVAITEAGSGKECSVPHYDMGSGFVKIPAAWLIEQCGWKGYREGNAGVYDRQPLVLINVTGKAAPSEIMALEDRIVSSVHRKFGITLTPEVEHV